MTSNSRGPRYWTLHYHPRIFSPRRNSTSGKSRISFCESGFVSGGPDQLQKPGDYFTIDWPEAPVCVALDRSGKMHAFSPVCRHRSTLVTSGEGNTRFFQCPYHGWTYSLSGELVGAPDMDRTKEFDKSLHCLPSIKVAEWEGFIFINLRPRL